LKDVGLLPSALQTLSISYRFSTINNHSTISDRQIND